MNPRVFREYDIRGVAERDLPDGFARDLGRALGTEVLRAGGRRLVIGHDPRLSSPRIHRALCEGLRETGASVLDIGAAATPVLYFAVFHLDADGGVQVTGSHNPAEDNGFKILRGKATIHGAAVQALRARMEAGDFLRAAAPGSLEHVDVLSAYVRSAGERLRPGPRRFKVTIDAGNGAGGPFITPLLAGLGFSPHTLYAEPDGHFPHHHPDPTIEANLEDLRRVVQDTGAELGIGLDGDADRMGVVDGRGRIVSGDQVLMLFARALLAEHPGATIVTDVKSSQAVFDDIARRGGRGVMCRVGHSLIKERMKAEGALLAGEVSGHFFFADRYLGFDDGIYAAARLCEVLSHSQATLAELCDTLPAVPCTPELRLPCPDDVKFEVVRRAVDHFRADLAVSQVVEVDGARVLLEGGWGLVRASNTGPMLVLRFEAETAARLLEVRGHVERALSSILRDLGVAAPASIQGEPR